MLTDNNKKESKSSSLKKNSKFHRISLWLFVLSGILTSHDSDALNKIAMFSNKKTEKTKLVDWQFEGTEWIIRFGEKNLEIVMSWNWKQKSIFGILETEALQKKNENGRSLKFSVL